MKKKKMYGFKYIIRNLLNHALCAVNHPQPSFSPSDTVFYKEGDHGSFGI